ncbi:unnamed protein product, partial [Brassica rapa subsp. narinosa]
SLPPSPLHRLLPLSSPYHLRCIFLLHDVVSFHAFIFVTKPEDKASWRRRKGQGGEGAIRIGGEEERIG